MRRPRRGGPRRRCPGIPRRTAPSPTCQAGRTPRTVQQKQTISAAAPLVETELVVVGDRTCTYRAEGYDLDSVSDRTSRACKCHTRWVRSIPGNRGARLSPAGSVRRCRRRYAVTDVQLSDVREAELVAVAPLFAQDAPNQARRPRKEHACLSLGHPRSESRWARVAFLGFPNHPPGSACRGLTRAPIGPAAANHFCFKSTNTITFKGR